MNIVLDITKDSIYHILLLEKKRNIIIDGYFTKFIYSNQYFTMTCIYIKFPLEFNNIDKNNIYYNPFNSNNMILIQEYTKLENNIIDYYKKMNNTSKKAVNNLSKQLYSGIIKVYNLYNSNNSNSIIPFVIKLSGVWENITDIGITYKIYKL